MSVSIEAEVLALLRRIAATATRTGGMDAATYEALRAASSALSSDATPEGMPSRLAALSAASARLRACEAENQAKAA